MDRMAGPHLRGIAVRRGQFGVTALYEQRNALRHGNLAVTSHRQDAQATLWGCISHCWSGFAASMGDDPRCG
jgi:hypothetical protein